MIGMACLVTVLFVIWKTFHRNLLGVCYISAFLFIAVFTFMCVHISPWFGSVLIGRWGWSYWPMLWWLVVVGARVVVVFAGGVGLSCRVVSSGLCPESGVGACASLACQSLSCLEASVALYFWFRFWTGFLVALMVPMGAMCSFWSGGLMLSGL